MGNTQGSLPGSPLPEQPSSSGYEEPVPTYLRSSQHPEEAAGGDGQHITVDIRGPGYNLYVKPREPAEQTGGLQRDLQIAGGIAQACLSLIISVLTVGKLYEEIRFVRGLRRELAHLSASLSSLNPGNTGFNSFSPTSGPSHNFNTSNNNGLQTPAQVSSKQPGAPDSKQDNNANTSLADQLRDVGASLGPAAHKASEGPSWTSISGLDDVKQLLQEVTVLPTLRPDLFKGVRQPPRGILLFGPPGSGKTLLARAVAKESHATFFAITGSSVLSMWYGQSEANVRSLFEKARQHQPAVIFIDEVDSLLGKRSGAPAGGGLPGGGEGSGTTPDRRVTNEFLSFIDGIQTEAGDAHIVVMAATNHPWDLDEAALSRFSRRIYVPLPDKHTRAQLLSSTMKDVQCDITPDQYLQIADKAVNYSGRDLIVVCREASMRPLRELWGKRLLTSASPAESAGATTEAGVPADSQAAKTQVVALIANHLSRGQKEKRVRKELTSWCALHQSKYSGGDAAAPSWLNVDTLMSEAQAQVQAQLVNVGSTRSGNRPPDLWRGGSNTRSRFNKKAPGHTRRQSINTNINLDAGQLSKRASVSGSTAVGGDANGGCGANSSCLQPGTHSGSAGSATQQTDQVANGGGSSEGGASQQNGVDGLPADRQGSLTLAGEARDSKHEDEALGSAAKSKPGLPYTRSLSTMNGDSSKPTGGASAGGGAASKVDVGAVVGGIKAEPQALAAGTKGRAGQGAAADGVPGPALTLEQLMTLPDTHVRPVTVADFEVALKHIMPSELDLSHQYDEFNQRYGSGTDVKRGASARDSKYMLIYT